MSEESMGVESEESRGLSRRAALKAGVATGVGVAAWSGMSITSLGGTPAYAAGCTGASPPIPLLDCRNTDQGNCTSVRYHTLKGVPFPYSVTNNIVPNSGICCTDFGSGPGQTPLPHFLFPGTSHQVIDPNTNQPVPNQKCTVFMEFYIGGDTSCENRNLNNRTGWLEYGPSTTGDITIFGAVSASCPGGTSGACPAFSTAGTKVTIFAICTPASFPDSCFTPA